MEGTGDKGYITGKGTVVEVEPAERDDPIAMSGEDLDGESVSLEDYRGKPVVVTVWGSWCPPCRAEAPALAEAAAGLDGRVGFLGINVRDPAIDQAQSFVRRFEIPFASVYSPDGKALLSFAGTLTPNTIPSTLVLDAQGRVAASIIGEVPSKVTLTTLAEDVLAETAASPPAAPSGSPRDG